MLTLVFLPALYVVWFRIKEPRAQEVCRFDQLQQPSEN